MQNGWSYVKDSSDFKNKIKKLGKLSGNVTLIKADVVALYPSIPHEHGLETLREWLVKSHDLKLPVNDVVKMAEFVLKNNIFESNGTVKQQIAGTAIATKFALPYACIYIWGRDRIFKNARIAAACMDSIYRWYIFYMKSVSNLHRVSIELIIIISIII